MVNYDGEVSICCTDLEADLIVGDLNKDKLINISKNNKYKQFREFYRKGQFEKMPQYEGCQRTRIKPTDK